MFTLIQVSYLLCIWFILIIIVFSFIHYVHIDSGLLPTLYLIYFNYHRIFLHSLCSHWFRFSYLPLYLIYFNYHRIFLHSLCSHWFRSLTYFVSDLFWFIIIVFYFIHYVHIDSGLLPTLYLIYFDYHRIFPHSLCSHWFRSLTYLVSDLFWLSSYFPSFIMFTLIQVSYLPCIWFILIIIVFSLIHYVHIDSGLLPTCIWFILIIIVFSFIHYVHIDSGLLPTLYLIYFDYHRIFLHSLCSHWFRSLTYLVSDLFWLSSYFPSFIMFTLIQVSYLPCIWFILIIIVFSFIHYVHIDSGLLPTLYLIYFNYHRIFPHSLCSHWFRSLTYLVSDLF